MNIDLRQLRLRCTQTEESFRAMGGVVTMTPNGHHIWFDRGSNVLAVAHLDSVIDKGPFCVVETHHNTVVFHPTMDDRLGVYIIMDLLPALGIVPDVLLTTGEESGYSTAQYFESPKEYKWMFQFDRSGCDVVLYQYDHAELRDRLGGCGFIIEDGLFSDISYMDGLGISGINFGCAYYMNHGTGAHAFTNELVMMVENFQKFWKLYKDERIEAPEVLPRAYRWSGHNAYDGWEDTRAGAHIESMADVEDEEWAVFNELTEFYIEGGYSEDEAEAMAWQTLAIEETDDSKPELGLTACEYCGYLVNPRDHWTMEEHNMCTYCWEAYQSYEPPERWTSLHSLTEVQFNELQKRNDE